MTTRMATGVIRLVSTTTLAGLRFAPLPALATGAGDGCCADFPHLAVTGR
jgi:hypothetical protein